MRVIQCRRTYHPDPEAFWAAMRQQRVQIHAFEFGPCDTQIGIGEIVNPFIAHLMRSYAFYRVVIRWQNLLYIIDGGNGDSPSAWPFGGL